MLDLGYEASINPARSSPITYRLHESQCREVDPGGLQPKLRKHSQKLDG